MRKLLMQKIGFYANSAGLINLGDLSLNIRI